MTILVFFLLAYTNMATGLSYFIIGFRLNLQINIYVLSTADLARGDFKTEEFK